MDRSVAAIALATLLAAPAPAPALADDSRADFRVSVHVAPRATLAAVAGPAALEVTAADLARGYLEIEARYRVNCNTRRGYLLRLAPRSGLAREVGIRGLDADLVLRDEPVEVHRRVPSGEHGLTLGFRVLLDDAAEPGRYPLPYEIAVLPL